MEKYTSENSELVARAIGYIRENNCDPEITVGDVARGAGFSENYFNRVFALHTGFSVMEYVRHERLRAAAEALRGRKRRRGAYPRRLERTAQGAQAALCFFP